MHTRRWVAAVLVSVLIGTCAVSWGEEASQPKGAPDTGATAAAVASDILYVPGKAIVCGVSGVLWVTTMALTFGALYQEAAHFMKGGCGGQWVLTGEDIKPAKSY